MAPPVPSAVATPGGATPLQGTLLSPQRKLALIDGAVVPMGGRTRDGTLAEVGGSSAIVRRDGAAETLELHPGVTKRRRDARTEGR